MPIDAITVHICNCRRGTGAVVEIVAGDGADHSSMEQRIELVLLELDAGSLELRRTRDQTCDIVPMVESESRPAGSGMVGGLGDFCGGVSAKSVL